MIQFDATRVLHAGQATGEVLKLSQPLSFWGGFNPTDGRILDVAHPQSGQSVTNRILALPGSRGSAGTPAGIAEAIRQNVGPAAILLLRADINIATGVQVAERLYGVAVPVLCIPSTDFDRLQTGQRVTCLNKTPDGSGSIVAVVS